jgi:hypothetical protein
MKKLLLLISSLGLFFSLGYGQSAFDYYVYEDGGSTHTLAPFNYDAPPSWFNETYIKGAAFSPYDSNFTVGYLVYDILGGGMDLDNNMIADGKYALNLDVPSAPELISVTTAGAYQGAPRVIAVTAGQSDIVDSKAVNIEYGLLLGQGKGEAYVEYWFKGDPVASKWENIDNANVIGTKEGIILESASGYYTADWDAGNSSFANNINTPNAQIRVTAKLGNTESGWNGEGNFTSSSSPGGGGSATFELFDVNDALGVAYWDPAAPEGYSSSTQKRDSILSASGLVSVGTYNDGVQDYPVYDFLGKESYRDQFAGGLTGQFYSINDTNIVQVVLTSGGGS